MGKRLSALFICTGLLFGCGGSDNDSSGSDSNSNNNPDDTATVEGLEIPDTMSVVAAKSGSGGTGGLGNSFLHAKTYDDAGTNYSTDETRTYVYDASMEALSTVNMILCLMAQTGATEMVNQGAYIALVNEDDCEQGENQSSTGQTGQSSSGNTTEFNTWTINSTRASNTAPQIVQIWVPGENHDDNGDGDGDGPGDVMDAQTILVEVTINDAPSDASPYGDFVMNFKGVIDAALLGGQSGTEATTMRGSLQTVENNDGLPQFRFINLGGDSLNDSGMGFGFAEAVNVIMDDASGSSGQAITRVANTFNDGNGPQSFTKKYAVAFDTGHLIRGKDTNNDDSIDEQQCLSRDDFNTNVWRYNLYHRDNGTYNNASVVEGQRVELNSGFPFSYDRNDDGTDDAHGWVGYHGVWTEGGMLADGATINRFDHTNDTTEAYTVNVSNGKLIRRTAETALLNEFQGDEFQYWGQHPTLNIFGQWMVTVDSNNNFSLVSTFNWGQNGPETSSTVDHDYNPQTPEVAVAADITLNNGQNLWLWSDALGGNIVYVHDDNLAASARQVTFYGQEFVTSADNLFANGNVTLYCYERCLKGGLTQTNIDNANSDQDLYYHYNGTPFEYTLASSGGKITLTDVTSGAAVSAASLNMTALGYNWGINTGEMITTPLADPSRPWRVFEQTVSYRWETGPNDWNKQITVTNSNNAVSSFDPPLRFTYTHSTANDANGSNSHDGKKFMLEYGGVGQLWGFPWVEDDNNQRWHAAVTLADGVELANGDNTFVVKAIEKEQTMRSVDVAECSAFDLNAVLNNPDITLPTASAIGNVSFTLADKPNVTDAPAVIEGEIQD